MEETEENYLITEDGQYDYGECKICKKRIIRPKKVCGSKPTICSPLCRAVNMHNWEKERQKKEYAYLREYRKVVTEKKKEYLTNLKSKAEKYDILIAKLKKLKEEKEERLNAQIKIDQKAFEESSEERNKSEGQNLETESPGNGQQ